jgi:Tol biopolymer transport system component
MWRNLRLFFLIALGSLCLCADTCRAESASSTDRVSRAFGRIIGEEILSANAIRVCQRAQSIPDEARYQYLADWVFPSPAHRTLRLQGDLLQSDVEIDTVVSPVFELLKLARTLNRVAELRTRLEQTHMGTSNEQQRARLAMQILLSLESGEDLPSIDQDIKALLSLIEAVSPTNLRDVWPETLVATYGMRQSSPRELIGELLQLIKGRRSDQQIPHHASEWHGLIFSLTQQFAYQQSHRPTKKQLTVDRPLSQWSSISRLRGYSQGSGFSRALWKFDGVQIEHVSGNDEDYLLYQSPLLGDLAFDFEIPSDSQSQVFAGGSIFGPQWYDHFYFGDLRSGAQREVLDPRLNHLNEWVHGRVEFRGNTRSCYLNGRCVRTDVLTEPRYPWLGHHSWFRNRGRLRDVRITGQPVIPDSIPLVVDEKLHGWHSYHEAEVGSPNASWRYAASTNAGQPQELVGIHWPWLAGTQCERLLMYQRPLLEDGAIEYDFFYEAGRMMVFPALDRLAFLVDPQGVSLHRITDDICERKDLSPDNVITKAASNKRPPQLRSGDWNQMRVEIAGQIATLSLNGQPIFEYELEATNSRQFGFFHYADQTGVRVRNVVMSGHWPKTLPPVIQQELANQTIGSVEADTSKIETVFHHQFSTGIPDEYFSIPSGYRGGQIEQTAEGLKCTQISSGVTSKAIVRPQFEVRGDFDISVRFADWESTGHDFCGASLELVAASGHRVAVTRRVQNKTHHYGVLEWGIPKGNGQFQNNYQVLTTEATGGSLRVLRQGDVWHALFADHDSSVYRIIGTVTMEATASQPVTFDLTTVAGEQGRTQFNWKEFRLAADEIFLLPDASQAPKPSIFTMNADGTDLQRVSRPQPDEPAHGSPDWSADGKQLLFDCWRGSAGSKMFLMNADGSNSREVGAGAMPTFAPDGQRLAFSGADGMCVMNVDGTGREVIAQAGWGAQWSPDGKWVSYGAYRGLNGVQGANIAMTHVKTRETRYLFEGEHAQRYSQVYWNMEWSPDSQRICFKGSVLKGGLELAITEVAGSSHGFETLTTEPVEPDISWHPNGKKLLVPRPSTKYPGFIQLFECDIATKSFTELEGQPARQHNTSGAWSPDGKRIAFVTTPPAERIPWKPSRQE